MKRSCVYAQFDLQWGNTENSLKKEGKWYGSRDTGRRSQNPKVVEFIPESSSRQVENWEFVYSCDWRGRERKNGVRVSGPQDSKEDGIQVESMGNPWN